MLEIAVLIMSALNLAFTLRICRDVKAMRQDLLSKIYNLRQSQTEPELRAFN
jgi:hypothetical protein